MASLREAFESNDARTRRTCRVRQILNDLNKDDRSALEEAIATRGSMTVAIVLKGLGYQISDTTIRTHKIGACSCG